MLVLEMRHLLPVKQHAQQNGMSEQEAVTWTRCKEACCWVSYVVVEILPKVV